jgi:hypothetical protein
MEVMIWLLLLLLHRFFNLQVLVKVVSISKYEIHAAAAYA